MEPLLPALVVMLGGILIQLRRIESRLDKQQEFAAAQAAVSAEGTKKLAVALAELARGGFLRAREQSAVDAYTGGGRT